MNTRSIIFRWLAMAVPLVLLIAGCSPSTPTPNIEVLTPTCEVASLIEAINDANNDGVPSEIQLPANCVYPLTTADNTISNWNSLVIHNGLPIISSEIIIRGNNAVIDIAPNSTFGHFFLEFDNKLSLYDLTLSNGARPVGGAVINNHGDLFVSNVKFLDNFAYPGSGDGVARGGAIFSTSGNVRIMEESIFQRNLAGETMPASPNLGGAVYSLNSRLTISNSYFVENYAAGNGGAVYSERNPGDELKGGVIINNTEFSRNWALQDGGALYLLDESEWVIIARGFFTENIAEGLGGGIFSQDSSLVADDSEFFENEAVHGGAVFTRRSAEGETSSFESDDSTYNNNTASGNGGAIFSENSDVELDDVFATNNQAASCGAIQLGGYPVLDLPAGDLETAPRISSQSEIIDSNFTMDEALSGFGGAACHVMGELTIRRTEMQYNQAATYGGALISMDELEVSRSQFRQNQASRGGGLAVGFPTDDNNPLSPAFLDFTSRITGSFITDNQASDQGGGIWTHHGGWLWIRKSAIGNNAAANEGGGFYQYAGGLGIENSTIAENTAWRGGGLYTEYTGSTDPVLNLTHVTVAYNVATDGGSDNRSGGGGLNLNGTVFIDGSLVALNTNEDCDLNQGMHGKGDYFVCNDPYCYWRLINKDSDDTCGFDLAHEPSPQLDSFNGTYVPFLAGSPLIDLFNVPMICNPADDQLDNFRPQGSECEPGAIEYASNNPPPPPPSPPKTEEPDKATNCDPFEGLEIGVYVLSVNPETLSFPVYLRFPGAVPGLEEGESMPYRGTLGTEASHLCNQQGFPDRLYCMFTLQPGDVGTLAELAIFKDGCDDPVFTQPRLTIPEIQQPEIQQPESTCKKDLGEDACIEAGGTWFTGVRDPFCLCP
ncbi:MAG: hypothetical protein P1P76_05105 [Anaerolineales bacterium]|nr:hypothetical protein [Anaerolineales bacterium]